MFFNVPSGEFVLSDFDPVSRVGIVSISLVLSCFSTRVAFWDNSDDLFRVTTLGLRI